PVEERKACPDLLRGEELDPEAVGILERALRDRALPERAVGVQPEVAVLAEADLGGVRAKEVQRCAAGLDVDGLPPGRPCAARVELGRRIESREVEVDHDDALDAPGGQAPRDPGAHDAAAYDEDTDALHACEGILPSGQLHSRPPALLPYAPLR